MPSLKENLQAWNSADAWSRQGEEWSEPWGGSASQWFGSLLPRLRSYVPAHRILEIAPGFGRWTRFLRPLCAELVLVDLSPLCIDACRTRFAGIGGIEYHVNDGRSLDMVADDSIDLVFSFDSLVHVEQEIVSGYLAQIARKLTPDGVAFIHHSNLGEYVEPTTGAVSAGIEDRHWRALSVSATTVRLACADFGLVCVSQEMINWGGAELIDVITVAARGGSRWSGRNAVLRNADFAQEATYHARLAEVYDWGTDSRAEHS